MPRKPLTEDEKSLIRRKACRAARKLLHAEGPSGLTIRAVASEIGMSAMSLYTYFENKAALLGHMRAMAVGELADSQEEAARLGGDDAGAALEALGRAYQTFAESRSDDFMLAFGSGEDLGRPAPEMLRKQIARAMAPSRDAVDALAAAGRLQGSPQEAHMAIWSAWHGYAMLSLTGCWNESRRPEIERIGLKGELTMNGATPRPTATVAADTRRGGPAETRPRL